MATARPIGVSAQVDAVDLRITRATSRGGDAAAEPLARRSRPRGRPTHCAASAAASHGQDDSVGSGSPASTNTSAPPSTCQASATAVRIRSGCARPSSVSSSRGAGERPGHQQRHAVGRQQIEHRAPARTGSASRSPCPGKDARARRTRRSAPGPRPLQHSSSGGRPDDGQRDRGDQEAERGGALRPGPRGRSGGEIGRGARTPANGPLADRRGCMMNLVLPSDRSEH